MDSRTAIQQWDPDARHGEVSFHAEVNLEKFRKALESVDAIVNEAAIELTEDGMKITAVDPPNVALVHVDVDCVEDGKGGILFGAMIDHLLDCLPSLPYYDTVNINDTTTEEDSDIERSLTVRDWEGYRDLKAFNPQTVRDTLDSIPAPEDAHDITLPAYRACGVFGPLADCKGHMIRLTPDGGELGVENVFNGDVVADWWIDASVGTGERAHYSADYIGMIFDGLQSDSDVRLRFSEDQPLRIDQDWLTYVLAPRITTNPGGDSA